ncbi:MAG: hypothetical protein U0T81_17175 [Saprospiraceae bacterium]
MNLTSDSTQYRVDGSSEIMGDHARKDAIYMDPDSTEADHLRAAEMEADFGEMGGYTAESDAASLISNLGASRRNIIIKS